MRMRMIVATRKVRSGLRRAVGIEMVGVRRGLSLLSRGGMDGTIHRRGGPEIRRCV
ncbi:hypothetical protein HD593_011298 [Nonomuraea rubra]|uniref:Uncharacterized protein n=1 Tax=Nonomuraea rubra TaxID=46180 RepID=A0A7X0P720_9ACTN|nr:hypothetical protein [Nonomuraea rubra]